MNLLIWGDYKTSRCRSQLSKQLSYMLTFLYWDLPVGMITESRYRVSCNRKPVGMISHCLLHIPEVKMCLWP